MSAFVGVSTSYEDEIYEAFLDSFVRAGVTFLGTRVSAQRRPETKGKGYSFWHVVSEAPSRQNRNEEDRIPDISRCERVRWIAWAIEQASIDAPGFSWWENRRGRGRHVVIWSEQHDYVVILAARNNYFLLKTAFYGIKPHRRRTFKKERDAFQRALND